MQDMSLSLFARFMSPPRDSISHDQTKVLHVTQTVVVEGGRLESDVRHTSRSMDPADRQMILP
jgi:hypothetical protein